MAAWSRSAPSEAPLAWKRSGEYMLQTFGDPGSGPLTPPLETRTRELQALVGKRLRQG